MTDRTVSLLVTLDNEYRIDDIQEMMTAIQMIKGVLLVMANNFNYSDNMNRIAIKSQVKQKLLEKMERVFEEI